MIPSYLDERFRVFIQVVSEDMKKILDERYFDTNPLTCPKEYLPYLAVEVGVNIDGLSEKEARIAIDEVIKSLNIKGTVKSLKSSLKAFADAEVKEWFESGKEPFIFDLDLFLTDKEITPELIDKLKGLIEFTKNIRSKLDELILAYRTKIEIGMSVGNIGETRSEAEMIDGFTNSARAFAYAYLGTMGEAKATAEMEEIVWAQ